jgi:glycosyltransferase involved in cell wall biosynthesis
MRTPSVDDVVARAHRFVVPPTIAPRRFDRVAITCVFGEPRNPKAWSGAPNNLASALERLGVIVESIYPRPARLERLAIAARYLMDGYGWPQTTEQIRRSAPSRRGYAGRASQLATQLGVRHILHTGALDLPSQDQSSGIKHYLYCDHTWALSLRHRLDAARLPSRAVAEYERLERDALQGLEHVFTFGRYVRDNLIEHYGLPPARVTAVGSGMGAIQPYDGAKDCARPHLLFVAKHLFVAKGGALLCEAFAIACRTRPDLRLTIVGDERSHRLVPRHPNIILRSHLPWRELERLYREATVLAQPMLNDPWGQVYLEALVSRTPVIGLRRNGLPEIIRDGRYGFLVDQADPGALANVILEAMSDPARLARMGQEGQQHVLDAYSWDRVAAQIAWL